MSPQAFWIGLLAVAVVVGLFLFFGWILMLLVNVVLGHYDAKLLDYGSALAIEALIALFLGGRKASD